MGFNELCATVTFSNRVWFPYQDPTTNLGARDWMDWLLVIASYAGGYRRTLRTTYNLEVHFHIFPKL